jgi:peptidoglycan hydrolase-like protein with peptidoglycan-binding domain
MQLLCNRGSQLLDHQLRLGMRGADVRVLQRFLNANGFALAADPIEARTYETGYFGPATQAALKAFQQAHQLPQTGKTDAATRAKLNG